MFWCFLFRSHDQNTCAHWMRKSIFPRRWNNQTTRTFLHLETSLHSGTQYKMHMNLRCRTLSFLSVWDVSFIRKNELQEKALASVLTENTCKPVSPTILPIIRGLDRSQHHMTLTSWNWFNVCSNQLILHNRSHTRDQCSHRHDNWSKLSKLHEVPPLFQFVELHRQHDHEPEWHPSCFLCLSINFESEKQKKEKNLWILVYDSASNRQDWPTPPFEHKSPLACWFQRTWWPLVGNCFWETRSQIRMLDLAYFDPEPKPSWFVIPKRSCIEQRIATL